MPPISHRRRRRRGHFGAMLGWTLVWLGGTAAIAGYGAVRFAPALERAMTVGVQDAIAPLGEESVRVSVRDRTVTLSGDVDASERRDALLAAANGELGVHRVVDRLDVRASKPDAAPGPDASGAIDVAAAEPSPDGSDATGMEPGDTAAADLPSTEPSPDDVVETDEPTDVVLAELPPAPSSEEDAASSGEPAETTEDAATLPLPELRLDVVDRVLTIDGLLSKDDDAVTRVMAAMDDFELDYVSNTLVSGTDVARADWLEPLIALLPSMAALDDPGVEIAERRVVLYGTAPDPATHDTIVMSALERFGDYSLVDEIDVVEDEPVDEPMAAVTDASDPVRSAADDLASDGAVADEAVDDAADVDALPDGTAFADAEPDDESGSDPASIEAASDDATGNDSAPDDMIANEAVSDDTTEDGPAPDETIAEEAASDDTTEDGPAPDDTIAKEAASDGTTENGPAPNETIAEEAASDDMTEDGPAPDETIAEEAAPDGTTENEPAPDEIVADEAASDDTIDDEVASDDTAEDGPAPDDTIADETASDGATATDPIETALLDSSVDRGERPAASGSPVEALRAALATRADRKILFESGSATLTADSLDTVDDIARVLLAHPDIPVAIEGHTDGRGFRDANLDLSQRRANAVRDRLVSRDVPRERLTTYGYGEGVPIADNATPEGRAANRRIEFTF